jgi:hypothetical protein
MEDLQKEKSDTLKELIRVRRENDLYKLIIQVYRGVVSVAN